MKSFLHLARQHPLEMLWLGILLSLAVIGPYVVGHDPYLVDVRNRLQGMSATHFFGTDDYGRDVFARLAHGSRIVVYVIVLSASLSALCGTVVGLIAGYFGGSVDLVLSRLIDAIQAFPAVLIGIMLAAAIRPSLNTAILAVAAFGTPVLARVVRGDVLRVREETYIEACRAIGATHTHIITRGILPNVLSSIIIQTSSIAPRAVITVAGLSFLGLGAQPPQPSWGAMIAEARMYMYNHPLYLITAIVALAITIISLNLLGDAVRDLLARKQVRL